MTRTRGRVACGERLEESLQPSPAARLAGLFDLQGVRRPLCSFLSGLGSRSTAVIPQRYLRNRWYRALGLVSVLAVSAKSSFRLVQDCADGDAPF